MHVATNKVYAGKVRCHCVSGNIGNVVAIVICPIPLQAITLPSRDASACIDAITAWSRVKHPNLVEVHEWHFASGHAKVGALHGIWQDLALLFVHCITALMFSAARGRGQRGPTPNRRMIAAFGAGVMPRPLPPGLHCFGVHAGR